MGIGFGSPIESSEKVLQIQFSDGVGKWRDLEQIRGDEHVLGRDSFRRATPAIEFLAAEHLRFVLDGDRLFVEEGDTLNGVFLKVPAGRPIELKPGSRFQVGQHVIEFQLPEPVGPDEAVASRDSEKLRWRRLEPLAFLAFAGPDNEPGLRFPLTKVDGTVIGREGDIALTGDAWASRLHARVVRQGARFFLEDLGSTNGTFVRVSGRTSIQPGNTRETVMGDVLLIGAALIRVIEI